MKKFIYKLSLWAVFSLISLNTIGFVAQYFLRKSSFYKPYFLANNFSNKDTLDYFILGSSRGLTTLNTNLIDKKLNSKGLNLAMDDTDLKTHLLMFKHFIKQGYKSKYCILTLDLENFEKSSPKLGNNDYRFSAYSNKPYVKDHYKAYENLRLKPLTNSSIFPFLAYAYYNLELLIPATISTLKPKYRNRFDNKGNYTYPLLNNKTGLNKFSLKERNISNGLLKEMKQLAEANNMQLILYIAPYKKLKVSIPENEIANTIVINHSNKIKEAALFYDHIHVNKKGRKLASEIFSKDFLSKIN